MQYVPASSRSEDVPCHHIPLDKERRTIATLDATDGEEFLKQWLRREINRLEKELALGRRPLARRVHFRRLDRYNDLSGSPLFLERETGLEPATSSLGIGVSIDNRGA